MKKKNNGLNASPKYYIQVGPFTNRSNAEKYWKHVKKYYPEAFMVVGAFSDKSNAEKFLKSVKKNYPEAFIKTF